MLTFVGRVQALFEKKQGENTRENMAAAVPLIGDIMVRVCGAAASAGEMATASRTAFIDIVVDIAVIDIVTFLPQSPADTTTKNQKTSII